MERLKVHPAKKQQAPPEARALLDDVERTMGIPWPPANWRTYAQFPGAMRLFWERLKPSVATEGFLEDALGITQRAYREVGKWYRPRFRPSLPPEVRRRIDSLAPGGGYVLAPANHLQPDVPARNVVALFRAARKYGRYPL